MTRYRLIVCGVVLVFLLGCSSLPTAQQDFDDVQIEAAKIREGIFMLTGRGGNIGVSVGKDGVFLIDDQFAALTQKIKDTVSSLSSSPIKLVFNTHWHSDHVGGNENFGLSGSLIVAHYNVRKRMGTEQFVEAFGSRVPASPQAALPVVTFDNELTVHLNDDEIHVFHAPSAHTDGDAVIHFRRGNVVHMGDLFFNRRYPFIDLSSGGSVDGMIAVADRVLQMIDSETKIIPGHGEIGDQNSLKEFRDMLVVVRNSVDTMVVSGKTIQEVIDAKPSKQFDEIWGKDFMSPEVFVKIVYSSLKKES